MNLNYFFILTTALLFGGLAGCSRNSDAPASSNVEIVGTYEGRYASGLELLEIHADGTFQQTFIGKTNNGYKSSGKWLYQTNLIQDGKTNMVSLLMFRPWSMPAGVLGRATNLNLDYGNGRWSRKPTRIEVGPWPYFLRKIQDDAP